MSHESNEIIVDRRTWLDYTVYIDNGQIFGGPWSLIIGSIIGVWGDGATSILAAVASLPQSIQLLGELKAIYLKARNGAKCLDDLEEIRKEIADQCGKAYPLALTFLSGNKFMTSSACASWSWRGSPRSSSLGRFYRSGKWWLRSFFWSTCVPKSCPTSKFWLQTCSMLWTFTMLQLVGQRCCSGMLCRVSWIWAPLAPPLVAPWLTIFSVFSTVQTSVLIYFSLPIDKLTLDSI